MSSHWLIAACLLAVASATGVHAQDWDGWRVTLETADGEVVEIATLSGEGAGYDVEMANTSFSDHFLSMRPFRCIEGPEKTWCHVPYPYEIARDTSAELTDLEYDFLFVWKGKGDYGINMWNGVYYVLEEAGGSYLGRMHEMDMDILAVPPPAGELRPIGEFDLEPADPDSHWLPTLRILPPER